MRTPEERARRHWERYVASIPYAIERYKEAHPTFTSLQIARYAEGLRRYAGILARATTPRPPYK